jgi:GNAT superfamily N-acetyltransferase
MMSTVTPAIVRPARRSDLAAIQAVIRAANLPFAAIVPADFFGSYLASAMDVAGRMDVATVLVAEQRDRIVGTVTAFVDANDEGMPVRLPAGTAGLRATAVHPDAQGQGIGRALVRACVDEARSHRARTIALHTAPFMHAAMALYEQAGFERVPAFDFPATAFFAAEPRADLEAIAYIRDVG